MKVLVVGSNGQLGKEITKQFQEKYELLLYDIPSLDITNYQSALRFQVPLFSLIIRHFRCEL